MTEECKERVRAMVAEHGRRAPQMLVDEIVAAVRASDDPRATMLDKQLRHAERLLEQADMIRTSQ